MNIEFLDKFYQAFFIPSVNVDELIKDLVKALNTAWPTNDQEIVQFVQACRDHPLTKILEESPLVKYALHDAARWGDSIIGDARMLKYLYQRSDGISIPELDTASTLAKAITLHLTSCPAALGVVARRNHIASLIEKLEGKKILSVACGLLPELQNISLASTLIALDTDPKTINELLQEYRSFSNVRPIKGNILRLRTNKDVESEFDLIYSLGLLDYFKKDTAIFALKQMYTFLRKGGTLIVANFTNHGYMHFMHTFMRWHLIYRTEEEMRSLVKHFSAIVSLTLEENQTIWLLEIKKPL